MARELTHIDHHDHDAVVALDPQTGEGIGLARYCRDPAEPAAAESAVTVVDEWQGRGVGRELLAALCVVACADGITRFTAVLLATNDRMMDLLNELGPVRVTDLECGTVEAEVSLLAPSASV
jgi:GNAT superfamily N-acetyltransferase